MALRPWSSCEWAKLVINFSDNFDVKEIISVLGLMSL